MVTTIRQIEAALNRDSRSASEGFLNTQEYANRLREFIGVTQSAIPVTLTGIHMQTVSFGLSLLNANIVSDREGLAALVADRRQVIKDLHMITLLDQTDEEILLSDGPPPMLSQDCRDEVGRRGVRFTYDLLLKLSPGTLILWRNG